MANVREQARKTRSYVRKEKVPERVPFGTVRLKMQLSDEDMKEFKRRGMVTRWFNDVDGRLPRALAGGYSYVGPEYATSLGQGALHRGNSDEGSKVSIIVSRGEPVLRAYLMEIPLKFWKQDQKAKAKHIEDLERADPLSGEDAGFGYGSGVTRH